MPSKKARFHRLLAQVDNDPLLLDMLLEVCRDAQSKALYMEAVMPTDEPTLDERDWWHIWADGSRTRL